MNPKEELDPATEIEVALEIAMKAHKGQRDLDDNPAILHPLAVAMMGQNHWELVAGLLHDVVEDSDFTFQDLIDAGISRRVIQALRLLTHNKDDDYIDYIRRIRESGNYFANNVKYHDLTHNMQRARRGDHLRLVRKYTEALQYIRPINDDEDAAWDLIMDDPEEGKFWQAKHAFTHLGKSIEEATASVGITVDEYMRFWHPHRKYY